MHEHDKLSERVDALAVVVAQHEDKIEVLLGAIENLHIAMAALMPRFEIVEMAIGGFYIAIEIKNPDVAKVIMDSVPKDSQLLKVIEQLREQIIDQHGRRN